LDNGKETGKKSTTNTQTNGAKKEPIAKGIRVEMDCGMISPIKRTAEIEIMNAK
jgi:hypothetical protein